MELDKEYRYESARRYYVARLSVDLLGDHVIDIASGGLFNRLGRCWTLPVATLEEGIAALVKIAHVRKLHRYQLISPNLEEICANMHPHQIVGRKP